MLKKLISLVLTSVLVSTSLSSVFAEEVKSDSKKHKVLALAYIMTFTDPNGKDHFAIINGEKVKVNVENGTTGTIQGGVSTFPKSKEEVRVIDIEEYNGSNFSFGKDLVTNRKVGEVETDYFYSYPLVLENAKDFKENYVKFTPQTVNYSSKNPKDNTMQANYSVTLNGNYMDYMADLKDGKGVEDIYTYFGGSERANSSVKTVLERFRGMDISEIQKYEGRLYFMPHIIIAEEKGGTDIVVSNGKATMTKDKVRYEYTLSLQNKDKVENVVITDIHKKEPVVIPLLEKEKPIILTNEIDIPANTEFIDINVEANKDKSIVETNYTNNTYIDKLELNDLEVVDIDVPSKQPPSTSVAIPVIVRNNSNKPINSVLNVNGFEKNVSFEAGEQKAVQMAVTTPKKGSINVVAEINKARTIKEITYENNKKSKTLIVFGSEPSKPTGDCVDTVEWIEVDSRQEQRTRTYTDSKGKTKTETYFVTVYYDFEYKATLTIDPNITDDRDNQKNNVTTKAGYGIKTNTTSKIDIKQVSGKWKREPKEANKKMPSSAFAKTSWIVKKIHTQNQKVNLEGKDGTFTTPINPSSKNKAKVIYTDIDLPDGKHTVKVHVSGASVHGQELCASKELSFKIEGDMYDDYKVS